MCVFSLLRMSRALPSCGKLVSWVNHRKFNFMTSSPAREIVKMNAENMAKTTLFEEDIPEDAFLREQHSAPEPQSVQSSWALQRSASGQICRCATSGASELRGMLKVGTTASRSTSMISLRSSTSFRTRGTASGHTLFGYAPLSLSAGEFLRMASRCRMPLSM